MREGTARSDENAAQEREKQRRQEGRPTHSLTKVEQLEQELRAAEQSGREAKQARENGTADSELKARVDKHCGGKAYEAPVIGLTEAQLLNCTPYVRPEKINTTNSAAGVTKQYVYRRFGRTEFVYFTNGRITAVQN